MYKFLLSSRYLKTRFIALASVVSVMLGVATMIVVNSVMAGFSTQMKTRIHGILADVVVETTSSDGTNRGQNITPDQLMSDVDKIAGQYIEAMTPTVETYGMLSFDWFGQTIYRPVNLVGIVPEGKNKVSPLAAYLESRQLLKEDDKLIRQRLRSLDEPLDWELNSDDLKARQAWSLRKRTTKSFGERSESETVETVKSSVSETATAEEPSTAMDPFSSQDATSDSEETVVPPQKTRIYVGKGLVSFNYVDRETGKTKTQYMAQAGEDLTVHAIKAGRPEAQSWKATIVDVFKSGMSEYDSNLVFCNIEELQHARGMLIPSSRDWRDGDITSLQIKLKNYDDAPIVLERLRKELPMGQFTVRTWEQKQGPLLQAVEMESAILNVLLFLIIAVAGFGILAIFYMIVVEKTKDIGILKALGASSSGILSIFLTYGLALGIVGSGVGVVLGLLFVRNINEIEAGLSYFTGRKVFDESIYYFQEIPTCVRPGMVIWVAFGAMLIAVLASVLPARRAAKLHPVRALRYE